MEDKTFQNFREWLLYNGYSTSNVDAHISNLRKFEKQIKNEGIYVEGEKVDELHTLYTRLSIIAPYSKRAKETELKKIKQAISRAFVALDREKSTSSKSNTKAHKTVDNQKSALTIYTYFLAEMFNEFTYDELVSDGLISPTRKRKPKIDGGVPMSPSMFKKGIVGLLRKCKAVLSSDSETVTIPLDMLHKLVEDAVQLHGGNMVNDIYKATSFMTASVVKSTTDWELALIEDMGIETEDGILYIGDEVDKITFAPEHSELEIRSHDSVWEKQTLACMAEAPSAKSQLGIRVMEQAPLYRQTQLLIELRNVCRNIKGMIAPYEKLQKRKLNESEYKDRLPNVFESIQMHDLLDAAAKALCLMKEYGKMFRIALVTE